MIEMAENDPQGDGNTFVMEALDILPNFSDSLQSNSILNRRIMKLKIEKGFAINQEETDSNMLQGQ